MDSIEVQQMKAQAKEEKARKKVSTLVRVTDEMGCMHMEATVLNI